MRGKRTCGPWRSGNLRRRVLRDRPQGAERPVALLVFLLLGTVLGADLADALALLGHLAVQLAFLR